MNARTLRRIAARIPADLERKEGTATAEDKLLLEMKEAKAQLLEAIKSKADADVVLRLQNQVDAIDSNLAERHLSGVPERTFFDVLNQDEGLKKFMRDRTGSYVIQLDAKQAQRLMERKTLIDSTAVGSQTTGVLRIDRTPGIVAEARPRLTLRNVLSARPTTLQLVDWVRVDQKPSIASPQTESSAKAENAVTFEAVSERVQTIATWIPASKQVLDDMAELMGYLETALPFYVDLAEELQILTGSGAGTDLNGLITQGTAFDTGLLSPSQGWTRIDIVGRAIQQITSANELQPTFIILHPNDWWSIRLTKDSQGRYIFPLNSAVDLFGLTPIVTTNISPGAFLIGSGSPIAAEIRDRMGMTIEIATQHSDWFAKNLIAIRAEKRLTLCVYRPASFITGTFTSSPA
jgi:HK97 family phage major capsid protein